MLHFHENKNLSTIQVFATNRSRGQRKRSWWRNLIIDPDQKIGSPLVWYDPEQGWSDHLQIWSFADPWIKSYQTKGDRIFFALDHIKLVVIQKKTWIVDRFLYSWKCNKSEDLFCLNFLEVLPYQKHLSWRRVNYCKFLKNDLPKS